MTELWQILAPWVDTSSAYVVAGGSVLPVLTTRGKQKSQFMEGLRRVVIPLGVLTSVVGAIMILRDMSNPSTLWPAIQVMLLGTLYGCIAYGIVSFLMRKTRPETLMGNVHASLLGSTAVLVLGTGFLFSTMGLSWIDLSAITLFGIGMVCLSFVRTAQKKEPLSYILASNSVIVGILCIIYSLIQLSRFATDPTAVGPIIAIAFCSSLYTGLFFTISSLFVPVEFRASLSRWSFVYLFVTLLCFGATFGSIFYWFH